MGAASERQAAEREQEAGSLLLKGAPRMRTGAYIVTQRMSIVYIRS